MRGINKVILVGNLGADPETRYTQSGTAMTNCRLATSENWTDKQSGEKRESTEWHRVVFFNRLAEIAAEYLRKGSKVYVEGQIRTRKWQDKSGQDRYTTEIIGREMQMLDSRRSAGESMGEPAQGFADPPPRAAAPPSNGPPASQTTATSADDFDDDLPF